MPGERLELSAPAQGGELVVPHLVRALGPAAVRGDRRVWSLTSPATVDLKDLGEINLTVAAPRDVELVLPQGFASWVREASNQPGRPVPRPGRRQLHVAFRLALPTRLPLLGFDLDLRLAEGQPVAPAPAAVPARRPPDRALAKQPPARR